MPALGELPGARPEPWGEDDETRIGREVEPSADETAIAQPAAIPAASRVDDGELRTDLERWISERFRR